MAEPSLTMTQQAVPDVALADVPEALRAPAEPIPGAARSAANGRAPRGRS
jgi:hypothetical protein